MAGTRSSVHCKQCQTVPSLNVWTKVLKSLQYLQLNEREFQTAGATLTLKALADNANFFTANEVMHKMLSKKASL